LFYFKKSDNMKYFIILFFSFLVCGNAFAQEKYTKHKVAKGETITEIAKKYKVTPYDIYRLNPDSQNGIKENTILLVPSQPLAATQGPVKEKSTQVANPIHTVQAKETLYSLAKKYNVTVDELSKANSEILKDGLQPGQKIIIPVKGSGVAAQAKIAEKQDDKKDAPSYMFHTVQPGETKYSIAKDYGMTLQLLEELNPEVKDVLSVGHKLKLSKNAILNKELGTAGQEKTPEYITYTVQPKETMYSLTKKTGLSQEKIIELNPEAKAGLKDGMVLHFPAGTPIADLPQIKGTSDLVSTLKKSEQKEIAILLPFNMDRIATDSIRAQRLRNDKFLNMTLDFYSGALMAIDSANALGIPVKIRILDSDETKNTSAIASHRTALSNADAVIGPFFQTNVEKTAGMLIDKNIPVISPLSKDAGAPYANLYQSVPSDDVVKMAMMDYLRSKGGNVVAIVDSKKASSRQFIKTNYPETQFLDGGVTESAMKSLFVKDSINYVILESENISMILNATKVLTALQKEYQVQLVLLEKTDAIDHEEIPLDRLIALKMIYPSVTKNNNTAEAAIYEKNFKKKNNIFPNQFATRGFDVTFDVILRLYQEEGFAATADAKASEQVENKFVYGTINGGNYNKGVYILQYNDDLSLTQAQ
jgi:LysM repeat protein